MCPALSTPKLRSAPRSTALRRRLRPARRCAVPSSASSSGAAEVYEGQWLTGTYEGFGTYLYASGDVYEGQYKAGKRDGRGTSVLVWTG